MIVFKVFHDNIYLLLIEYKADLDLMKMVMLMR